MKSISVLMTLILATSWTTGATLIVTKTTDDPVDGCDSDCSLREAVIAANATVEHDTIVVPAGSYVLSLHGPDEDLAATGDLDLLHDVTITGDPSGTTVIDGDLSDRLFHLNGATVALANLVLTRGSTMGDFYGAGGILVESGTLTMTRCVVSDCTCDGHGGGIFSLGTVTMERSAVTGNTGAYGGGIYHAGLDMALTNTTVSGNTSTTYFSGGVTIDGLAYDASFGNCTIADNTGPESDALSIRCPIDVVNTIIEGSCEVVDMMGSVSSTGGNIESPASTCELLHPTDTVSVSAVDLDLGSLQDNGGGTLTHALLIDSIAIDSGDHALCPAKDQRDWLRHDGACDIGAFEAGARGDEIFDDGFESGDTTAWSSETSREKDTFSRSHTR